MTVDQMRECLKKVYNSPKWSNKVDKFSDSQIVAVYSKFLRKGAIK